MKNKFTIAAVAAVLALSGSAFAQFNPGPIFQAGANDATKLAQAYMGPAFKAFGAGLNAGWYTTAATHTRFFPDLSINVGTVFVPSADQSFNPDPKALGLTNLTLHSPSTSAPTFSGDKSTTIYDLHVNGPGGLSYTKQINSPDGTNLSIIPVATAQLGIGIGWGTDIMVRYMPTIKISDNLGKVGLWGFGIKHDIKQWIPVVSLLPFDWSVLFGYTQFNYNTSASVGYDDYTTAPSTPKTANFDVNAKTQAYNFGTVVSKTVLFFTGYVGLGYQISSTTITVDGAIPVPGYDSNGNRINTNVTVPSITIDGANNPYATAGFRLRFLVITLNADYTFMSTYSNARLGLGVSF